MGHDIMIKLCPRPLAHECINDASCDHNTIAEDYISFNHSNAGNKSYWHVSDSHGHTGATVSYQLGQAIANMEADHIVAGIPACGDGWTATPGVFLTHLKRIKEMTDQYPNHTFLSDQCWSVKPYGDTDDDTDNEGDTTYYDTYDEEYETTVHPVGPNGSYVRAFGNNPRFGTLHISQSDMNPEGKASDDLIHQALNLKREPEPEPSKSSIVTYFRHPVKGNMKVHNFATASEVYAIMQAKGDPRAPQWLELAKQMHDSPL